MILRPLTPSIFSTALVLSLFVSACGKDKDQDTKAQASVSLDLQGTHWEQCSSRYVRTVDGTTTVEIFEKFSLDFITPTTARLVAQKFSQDKDCAGELSLQEVQKLTDGDIEALEPGASDEVNLTIASATSKEGVYQVDVIWKNKPSSNSYHLAAISGDTMEIADRCFDEEYVKEGLCSKVDGDRPDNRADTFGMFAPDRNIFTKVTK